MAIAGLSPGALYSVLGVDGAPLLIDVRHFPDVEADDVQIVGSVRRLPDELDRWCGALPAGAPVAVYGLRGQDASIEIAARLAAMGIDAAYLEGGIVAWRELGLPTRRRIGPTPGKWVTRERPTIDRIACPWLIKRFIDPEAELIYVPAANVLETTERLGATPYDVPNVEYGHHGEFCSFDAFIATYGIEDKALDRLSLVIRGADTGRPDLTPQSPGLLAISQGLKINFTDDHAMLAQGLVLYDALYAWCRRQEQTG